MADESQDTGLRKTGQYLELERLKGVRTNLLWKRRTIQMAAQYRTMPLWWTKAMMADVRRELRQVEEKVVAIEKGVGLVQ